MHDQEAFFSPHITAIKLMLCHSLVRSGHY